jgi:glutathione S-transferase
MIQLFSGPLSMFGAKAVIAALEKGLDFELVKVPFDSDDRYRPKHPEVLRINPKQQVPVLIHGDLEIYDSTQIFEYLEDLCAEPALWPSDINARARARLLEHQSDEVFFSYVVQLMIHEHHIDGAEANAARELAARYYERMEAQLGAQDYLAGSYSYADIAFFMAQLFGERKSAILTGATPGLMAWRDRMVRRDAVKQAVQPLVNHLKASGRPVPGFLL